MKKLALVCLLAVTLLTACHNRYTSIVVTDDDHYLKIEYAGTIVFNDDNSGIKHISKGGYFKCKNNYDKLLAEINNKGQMIYEVNGEDPTAKLNSAGAILMKDAVREIARQQGRR